MLGISVVIQRLDRFSVLLDFTHLMAPMLPAHLAPVGHIVHPFTIHLLLVHLEHIQDTSKRIVLNVQVVLSVCLLIQALKNVLWVGIAKVVVLDVLHALLVVIAPVATVYHYRVVQVIIQRAVLRHALLVKQAIIVLMECHHMNVLLDCIHMLVNRVVRCVRMGIFVRILHWSFDVRRERIVGMVPPIVLYAHKGMVV